MAQATQSGRQAGTRLPLGEGGSLSQAGSQASQAVTSQPGAPFPLGKEAVEQQALSFPLRKEAGRQVLSFPPG